MTTTAERPAETVPIPAETVPIPAEDSPDYLRALLADRTAELRACETACDQNSRRHRRAREQMAAEIVRLHYRLDQIAEHCLGIRPWSHKLIREYALDRSEVIFPAQLQA